MSMVRLLSIATITGTVFVVSAQAGPPNQQLQTLQLTPN
jgi:hypothetical protein